VRARNSEEHNAFAKRINTDSLRLKSMRAFTDDGDWCGRCATCNQHLPLDGGKATAVVLRPCYSSDSPSIAARRWASRSRRAILYFRPWVAGPSVRGGIATKPVVRMLFVRASRGPRAPLGCLGQCEPRVHFIQPWSQSPKRLCGTAQLKSNVSIWLRLRFHLQLVSAQTMPPTWSRSVYR
jgi:hypothetical protein